MSESTIAPEPGPVYVYGELTVTHPPVSTMTDAEKAHLGITS